jgi:hypothetical protein
MFIARIPRGCSGPSTYLETSLSSDFQRALFSRFHYPLEECYILLDNDTRGHRFGINQDQGQKLELCSQVEVASPWE